MLATSLPLPTMLSGVTVSVKDSVMTSRLASLFYVSPNQINFVVPDTTATGMATVTINNGDATPPSTMVQVAVVAPGLFTANSQGTGVAAAIPIPRNNSTQNYLIGPVFHFAAHPRARETLFFD